MFIQMMGRNNTIKKNISSDHQDNAKHRSLWCSLQRWNLFSHVEYEDWNNYKKMNILQNHQMYRLYPSQKAICPITVMEIIFNLISHKKVSAKWLNFNLLLTTIKVVCSKYINLLMSQIWKVSLILIEKRHRDILMNGLCYLVSKD